MSLPAPSSRDTQAPLPGLAGKALGAAAIAAPPLAVLAPLALAPLLAVLAALVLATDGRASLAALRAQRTALALIALIAGWAAVTALWSPIPGHSLFEAGRFLVIGLAGMVALQAGLRLGPAQRGALGRAALIGLALALALLLSERLDGAALARRLDHRLAPGEPLPLAHFDRGVTVLALTAWSGAAALAWRRLVLVLALGGAAILATIFAFDSHATMLAALAGLAACALAWVLPRLTALLLLLALAGGALALPVAAPDGPTIVRLQHEAAWLKPSAVHRLVIWRFAADRIAERKVLGWGMDAARAIPGGKEEANRYVPGVALPETAEALPLHTHDAALQWRLELGLPGALLCLAFAALTLGRLATEGALGRGGRALGLGYAASCVAILLLSFGAWQAWWLSTLWLGAAFLLGLLRADSPSA